MSEFTHPLHLFFRPKDSRGVYNNSIVQKNGKGLKSVQDIKQKSAKMRVTSNLLRTKKIFLLCINTDISNFPWFVDTF